MWEVPVSLGVLGSGADLCSLVSSWIRTTEPKKLNSCTVATALGEGMIHSCVRKRAKVNRGGFIGGVNT